MRMPSVKKTHHRPGVKKSGPRPKVKVTVEMTDLDHMMLLSMAQHTGKSHDQLFAEALILLFVSLPRKDDMPPAPEPRPLSTVGSIACTFEQAETVQWVLNDMTAALDKMPPACGPQRTDVPFLTSGSTALGKQILHLPSWNALGAMLYRLERLVPQKAGLAASVSSLPQKANAGFFDGHVRVRTADAKRVAAAIRKLAKKSPEGRAALEQS
jgi:prepilin-type processing-associated H-X9-DG protein